MAVSYSLNEVALSVNTCHHNCRKTVLEGSLLRFFLIVVPNHSFYYFTQINARTDWEYALKKRCLAFRGLEAAVREWLNLLAWFIRERARIRMVQRKRMGPNSQNFLS